MDDLARPAGYRELGITFFDRVVNRKRPDVVMTFASDWLIFEA